MRNIRRKIVTAALCLTAAVLVFVFVLITATASHGGNEEVVGEFVAAAWAASPVTHDLTLYVLENTRTEDVEEHREPKEQEEIETSSEPTPMPESTPSPTPGPMPAPTPEPEPSPTPELRRYNNISEGDVFAADITHYDVCIYCCGKLDGVTASGLVIKNGTEPEIPVASCNWLPLGTLVDVGGTTYIIADRGGKGLSQIGRLDIFVPAGHQAALDLGRIRGKEITVLKLPE